MINGENIIHHKNLISKDDRNKFNGHKSLAVWFTGLSGAGKSTIAVYTEEKLYEEGIKAYILDGDNLRLGLNYDLGFSKDDRIENIRRLTEVGKLFVDSGIVVLIPAISPYEEERNKVRNIFGKENFIEVYVKCSLKECERKDPKGLYRKARLGEIQNFTGISAPYEEPTNPNIILNTENKNVEESVEQMMNYLLPQLKLE